MRNRFKDALLSQGACNPGALCRSLAEIQSQMYAEGKGTDEVREDPACRLIAYQIGYLFRTPQLNDIAAYDAVLTECERQANVQLQE